MSNPRTFIAITSFTLLACTSASAQTAAAASSVQIYGLIDVYAGKKQLASATGASSTNVDAGGLSTSYWGFRGTEALSGGLSAIFEITGNVRVDTGAQGRFDNDPLFSRSAWAGLQSSTLGMVRLGRMSSPNFQTAIRLNPFAESTSFSPYLLHTYVGGQPLEASVNSGGPSAVSDSGYSNAITYNAPVVSGFSGALAYSPGEQPGSSSANRRVNYSLSYENGAFYAALAGERVSSPVLPAPPVVPAANQKLNQNTDQIGATWDFGPVKAFGSIMRVEIDLPAGASRRFRTTQLGASIPVGAGRVLASAAHTRRTQTAVAETNRTTWALGYDHFLSKRTDLYVLAMHDSVTNLKSGSSVVVGIRHRF